MRISNYSFFINYILKLFIFSSINLSTTQAQESNIGFIKTLPITQYGTSNDVLLRNNRLNSWLNNSPDGGVLFATSYFEQIGLVYRVSHKNWHLQAGILYTQNFINYSLFNQSRRLHAQVNTLNPEISAVRRFKIENSNIEFNWQIGLNAGFTANSKRSVIANAGELVNNNDTTNFFWELNTNALPNRVRLAVTSSFNVAIPVLKTWSVEVGVGIISELNKPNEWRYYAKSVHNNEPIMNYDVAIPSDRFNERVLYFKIGVFKKINGTKERKRTSSYNK
jgi:hypothetical protein